MKSILVTGGAGYIGSVLTRLLLKQGYRVRVIDRLRFGAESLPDPFDLPSFEFLEGDIRDRQTVQKALIGIDAVVHLAAIVGDPNCAKNPELATSTNIEGTTLLYQESLRHGISQFIFSSTCSNYGKAGEGFVNETTPLAPLSLYAQTKVQMETLFLENSEQQFRPTVLRFATVYGLSPRMRFDLTVNEFCKEISLGHELLIYGAQFWRPYCHVLDLAKSVLFILESNPAKTAYQVFNVGSTEENYRKKEIVDLILDFEPEGRVRYVEKEEDPRSYRVNFNKLNSLGFRTTLKVKDGIREIFGALRNPEGYALEFKKETSSPKLFI